MPAAPPGRKFLPLKEGAEVTGTSVRTLRRRIAEGELPAYRIGPRAIRVRLEDVEALARRIPTGGADSSPAA